MTAPLHLAIVVDSDAFGGAEVYAQRLVCWLPQHIRRTVIVAEPVAEHFGGERRVVPLHRHRAHAPAVANLLAELRPDVVQVNLVDPASNLAALDAAVAAAPTVATLHLQGTPPQRAFPAADFAVAPSATIAAQLRDLGMPADRVVRIRHGVELPPAAVKPRHRTPVVIGTVARLTPQKGLDLLIDAVSRLTGRGYRIELRIAGAGRDADALRERARGLPVTFTGLCRDVPAFLRDLDVFCLPSRREALSLSLLEAVSHGLPCVSSDVGDTAEALTGAALIVPPEDVGALTDALRSLLDDPARRADLGARARERALAELDVRRWAQDWAAVLHRAAVSRAARRPAPARR
ncbi:glycosyltransferase family 4 protein [Mycobacterium sp. MYCO198283]|uniref:glycosyltransferase family 4 protein n=1 Tax=Mycobacterium sp. MYCO198283 TaxID=2883505 RepID=UPI001E615696|nr:glycosyltransferase family 4 protein [Mycobacterium sp. MYCO198283]MCG5434123.1 glycosyltransferase family 4 protein [Mycobacterium sp. MYCO198283]